MKKFWNYMNTNHHMKGYQADTAYVLPKDYGYGFRGPNDTIWGLWHADELVSESVERHEHSAGTVRHELGHRLRNED